MVVKGNKEYINNYARKLYRKKHPEPIFLNLICPVCDTSFIQHSTKQKYCCNKCNKIAWKRNHPEQARRYNKTHKAEVNAATRKCTKNKRLLIKSLLGNKCTNPYSLPHPEWLEQIDLLQIDHVNSGGVKEIKMLGGSYYNKVLHDVQNGSKNYQLLCVACNWLKRYKNEEHVPIKRPLKN